MSEKERRPRRYSAIPYVKDSRVAPDRNKVREEVKNMGFFGSLACKVGMKKTTIEMDAEKPLRDFPFSTPMGTQYFSTRREVCAAFGLYHGQLVEYCRGPHTGTVAKVVGARNGRIWIVDINSTTAKSLHEGNKFLIQEEYRFNVVGTGTLEPASVPADLSPESIHFLQHAPDVMLQVGMMVNSTIALSPCYDDIYEGRVGWAGEGLIHVAGGGVSVASCSVSAALVVPRKHKHQDLARKSIEFSAPVDDDSGELNHIDGNQSVVPVDELLVGRLSQEIVASAAEDQASEDGN